MITGRMMVRQISHLGEKNDSSQKQGNIKMLVTFEKLKAQILA